MKDDAGLGTPSHMGAGPPVTLSAAWHDGVCETIGRVLLRRAFLVEGAVVRQKGGL